MRSRPVLRGWSHALAVPAAMLFTGALAMRCLGDRPRLTSMIVYGLSLILMYGWSAVYHIVTWSPARRRFMQQIDHANIFIVIAATATAIGANLLAGWERVALLVAVWTPTVIGLVLTGLRIRLPSWLRTVFYISIGLTGLIALPGLLAALPLSAILILVAGGLLYAIGGVIYSAKAPNPAPRIFGYHEIFHLFVIAGGVAFGIVVWVWVVPFVRA
jgi:hemolysin III